MTKDEIFAKLKEILEADFDVKGESIVPEAQLYDDLDLDSIDAVDMIVKMKEYVSGKIQADAFKHARTVQNVVDILYPLIQAKA
jgi:acyl carrier protein